MRIESVEVNNYKAFHGEESFKFNGKNIFIYGENGSGKSSLYYALKDFFQSSIEEINLSELENIFIEDADKGNCYVKTTFNPDKDGNNQDVTYTFSQNQKDTEAPSIRDANKLKSFFTYKHLLNVYNVEKDGEINLFDLLVKGVLKHYSSTLTDDEELKDLWDKIEEVAKKETNRGYNKNHQRDELEDKLEVFNEAFGQLFKKPIPDEPNPEYILEHANDILDYFDYNLEFNLRYKQAKPILDEDDRVQGIKDNSVSIDLKYAGEDVSKPHMFLNEARLSALSISIYLGMIKGNSQQLPCKILFLDDIFIGLDISNRLPVINILEEEFSEYQKIVTTYDKPWFEYIKSSLLQTGDWKVMEFFAEETPEAFEIPYIVDDKDLLDKADDHFNNSDYKAAAVYVRSAFEKMIIDYCDDNRKKVRYRKKKKRYQSQDFWDVIKEELPPQVVTDIKNYRNLVLNPFSHYNADQYEFKTELKGAIQAVKSLEQELINLR